MSGATIYGLYDVWVSLFVFGGERNARNERERERVRARETVEAN